MIDTTGKTIQQVSDEIAVALIKQGDRCVNDNGGCMYEKDGMHCAIGWLIPKDSDAMMCKNGAFSLMTEHFNELGVNAEFIKENIDVLEVLQAIHDSNTREGRIEELKDSNLTNIDMSAWHDWIHRDGELKL